MCACARCNAEQGKPPPLPPSRRDYVEAKGSAASRGVWSGIRPAESGMKGRGCWEAGTVRSLCNSGCLSKVNQGTTSAPQRAERRLQLGHCFKKATHSRAGVMRGLTLSPSHLVDSHVIVTLRTAVRPEFRICEQ
ncbi:hypothetical protein EYF80_036851 [Liparis tanakae]|uniref:Uncharacterized protein n=1 Tax=Liparis tanakae TaxID=230148 RepID=A0A4Z2GJ62_9TELE|nr:hypothetical protein EYF80_036851 [Liparis tanakae]